MGGGEGEDDDVPGEFKTASSSKSSSSSSSRYESEIGESALWGESRGSLTSPDVEASGVEEEELEDSSRPSLSSE